MSYQVGQAYKAPSGSLIVKAECGWEYLFGSIVNIIGNNELSPATEAEILAEAVKHGWGLANKKDLFSPNKFHHVKKANSGKWYEHTKVEIDNNNLLPFCEEGLIAHRLITALNLAK